MSSNTPAIDEIFLQALEQNSPRSRLAFLDQMCGDNRELRQSVEKLLRAHERQSPHFLDEPATGVPERDAIAYHRTVDLNPAVAEAGFAATFGSEAAVVIGSGGHSVLKSLGQQLTRVPHVTLRDTPDEIERIVKPDTKEIPRDQQNSKYQLLGEIARGGMGAVIKGRDTDLGRDLAIKVLLEEHRHKPEILERFVEEAQIGGQLQHPGIAPVYELGQFPDQRPFFTMKLVKGETLAAILSNRKKASDGLPKLLGIFEQVCQTMSYAHSKGVIHRDLKPANIMVGAFGEVQVMDWGLSKVLSQGGVADEKWSLDKQRGATVIQTRRSVGSDVPEGIGSDTRHGSIMGTPAYMPPEQAMGETDRLDERADVFGLGAILAEILTGKPPYVAKDASEVFRLATRGKLDECFTRLDNCGADSEVIEIARQALAAEAEDRPRTAGHLSQAMTAYLEGVQEKLKQTELARVEAETRSQEERKRKKLGFAIAALLCLLAVGAGIAAIQFRRIADQKRELALSEQLAKERAEEALKKEQAALDKEQDARRNAEDAKNQAEASLEVARSQSIREERPVHSLRTAISAARKSFEGRAHFAAHANLLNALFHVGGDVIERGPQNRCQYVAVSPDGRWLATDAGGGQLFHFDQTTGKVQLACRLPDGVGIAVSFSPDGRWLATGNDNNSVMLYDLLAQDIPGSRRELKGHDPNVVHFLTIRVAEFSPDSKWLISIAQTINSGSTEADPRLWKLDGSKSEIASSVFSEPLQPRMGANPESVVDFSPDGRWLATSSSQGAAFLWDLTLEDPATARPILLGPGMSTGLLDISADGRWLAVGGEDGTVSKWDLTQADLAHATPVLLGPADAHHKGPIGSMEISADSRWLATGGQDKTALLWDLAAEPSERPKLLLGHREPLRELTFASDSRWLFTGSGDGEIRRWDLQSAFPETSSTILRGHDQEIRSLSLSPNNQWLFSAGYDSIRRWHLGKSCPGTNEFELRFHDQRINVIAASPDQRWAATASADGTARILDLSRDNWEKHSLLLSHGEPVLRVLFTPDSQMLITVTKSGKIRLWEWRANNQPTELLLDSDGTTILTHFGTNPVALSDDGRFLAAGDIAGGIRIWDLQADDPQMPIERQTVSTAPIKSVDFAPDNAWLVTAQGEALEDNIRLFALRDGRVIQKPIVFSAPTLYSARIVGSKLIAHTIEDTRFWEMGSISENSTPRALRFKPLAFSPDGKWLIGTSQAGHNKFAVNRYDLVSLTHSLMWEHQDDVRLTSISADGVWLATSSMDQTVRVGKLLDHSGAEPMLLRAENFAQVAVTSRWVITGDESGVVRLWDLNLENLIDRAIELAEGELPADEVEEQIPKTAAEE